MLLLGIDVGTSSIKVSVVDAQTCKNIASASYPDKETEIIALKNGWAEQSPDMWWQHVQQAILKCNASKKYNPKDIGAIGIAYQMHGLVLVDKDNNSVRNSIIWCDSRAVEIGNKAFTDLGAEFCLNNLLNSPGNFTASKLAWVKAHEPENYDKIDKIMLPGDYIAVKLTENATTSASALSEGIFWDFRSNQLSQKLMDYFGFPTDFIPDIKNVFEPHGTVSKEIADKLGLKEGVVVSYKAGDQPNNALSLNVTQPSEVAATAGTSGVIYAVTDQLLADKQSRVNTFAHVSHNETEKRLGVLLCINGTGSLNRWVKSTMANEFDYSYMNKQAESISAGSEGLMILPFGNGAERMLGNQQVGAHIQNIDLNIHTQAHIYRAVQEGIAFAFKYGFDILKENGLQASVIRAGKANLFLSDVFTQSFVNVTGVPVELYDNDGSHGAAIGAGIGANVYKSAAEAFMNNKALKLVEPKSNNLDSYYQNWKSILNKHIQK